MIYSVARASNATGTRVRIHAMRELDPRWDDFVRGNEQATFCHLAGWRAIMTDTFGHRTSYLVAEDETGCCGVLPMVRVKNRVFGHHLLSVPYLSYGGPLGTAEVQRSLIEHAIAGARELGVDSVEIRARHTIPSSLSASRPKTAVLLDLPESPDALWRGVFRAKLRNEIARPLKEGLPTSFGPDQLEAFYSVFAHNMRDLGTPVLPQALFEAIARTFPEQVVFGAVYHDAKPVAAGCGFVWRDEFEMTWAASLREHRPRKVNMLLYWSFMDELIRRGVRVFNFGRSTPGSGPHSFKLQWGGRDVPLPWLAWSPSGSKDGARDGSALRLAASAWSRLPVGVSKLLGPRVARLLPYY